MSWEVWGTPPDPEPARCPMCGEESHEEGCELGKMQARAVEAERKLYAAEGRADRLARELADSQGCVSGWVTFGSNVTEALGLRVMSPKAILAEIARLRAGAALLPEGWKFNHAQQQTDEDGPVVGTWEIGWLDDEDASFSAILVLDLWLYDQEEAAEPLARAILARLTA